MKTRTMTINPKREMALRGTFHAELLVEPFETLPEREVGD
jgi:hypothetical protein